MPYNNKTVKRDGSNTIPIPQHFNAGLDDFEDTQGHHNSVNSIPRLASSTGALLDATANLEGIAAASAARTATLNSGDLTNVNCRGVIAYVNVTAAPGSPGPTSGLTVSISGKDPVSGNYAPLATFDPVNAVGGGVPYVFELSPGAQPSAGGVVQRRAGVLPYTFRITVAAGNTDSYTYSVGYALVRG